MKRMLLAALAVVLIGGGVLTMATIYAMRGRVQETPYKVWQVPDETWKTTSLLTSYELTDRTGKIFRSQDLAGSVHVVSFFFASCPNTCYAQNVEMQKLHQQFGEKGVKFLSISCNPEMDSPPVLQQYAKQFKAPVNQWHFLTGDLLLTRRIGGEIYQVHVDKMVHLDRLIVVDKWGKVRGSFHWKEPDKVTECQWLIQKLLDETEPPPAAVQAPATSSSNSPTEKDEE